MDLLLELNLNADWNNERRICRAHARAVLLGAAMKAAKKMNTLYYPDEQPCLFLWVDDGAAMKAARKEEVMDELA